MSSASPNRATRVAKQVARAARIAAHRAAIAVAATVMIVSSMPTSAMAQVASERAEIVEIGSAIAAANAKEAQKAAKKQQEADAAEAAEKAAADARRALAYNGNGATKGTMDPTAFKAGDDEKVTVAKNAFERDGYVFRGWSTTANGKDVKDDDDKVTMRAVFVPAETQIKGMAFEFDADGDGTVDKDETFDLSDCVRDQYITLYAQWITVEEQAAIEAAEAAKKAEAEKKAAEEAAKKQEQAEVEKKDEQAEGDEGDTAESEDAAEDAATDANVSSGDDTASTPTLPDTAQPGGLSKVEDLTSPDDAPITAEDLADAKLTDAPQVSNADLQALVESVADARAADNPEADGSRIESIEAKWIENPSSSRLSVKPKGDDDFFIRMKVDVAFSGQHDYAAGKIQITVSKNIVKNRDGSPAGYMTLAVPEAPDTRALFVYSDVGSNYVLTNTRTVPAASNATFEFTIRGLTPHKLLGNPSKYTTSKFTAKAQVTTHKGNAITRTSNGIDATFDTSEQIDKAQVEPELMNEGAWDKSWPASLKPSNPDAYVFVDWYSWTTVKGNQAFKLDVTHDISSSAIKGGFILGARDQNGKVSKASGKPSSMTVTVQSNGYYQEGARNYYVHFYAAYPRSGTVNGSHYDLKSKATYTLTSIDDGQKTSSSGTGTKTYSPLAFKDPGGHFNVWKFGNKNPHYDVPGNPPVTTNYDHIYGLALNRLAAGKAVTAEFDVHTMGFFVPWTWVDANKDGKKTLDEIGKKPVTMVTEDYLTQFNHSNAALTSRDFEISAIDIERPETYEYIKYKQAGYGYIDERLEREGVAAWGQIGAGEFGYNTVTNVKRIPDVEVHVRISDSSSWTHIATVSWTSGKPRLTKSSNGVSLGTSKRTNAAWLNLPANVTDFRTKVTSKEGAIILWTHPQVKIKASQQIKAQVAKLLKGSSYSDTNVRNWAKMTAYDSANKVIGNFGPKGEDDTLQGSSLGARAEKTLEVENDVVERQAILHYKATVREQTNITDLDDYKAAVKEGLITQESTGTWYDLLPYGVTPDLSSVKARYGDVVTSVTTKSDYKGSGRTLLIVKTKITPQPSYVFEDSDEDIRGMDGYQDAPYITFDATYSWESITDYGATLNNVIAFESGNKTLGNVTRLSGEPDNPLAGNNESSKVATEGVESLMTDLNPNHDNPVFLYARANEKLAVDTTALTSVTKRVAVNGSNVYSTGLDNNALNVYEGGYYSYRIRQENDGETKSRGLIFYDSLENYEPTVDKADHGDKQWRGRLASIDVSQIENVGAKPVIYYSTVPDLVLDGQNATHANLKNTAIWSTKAPADLSKVTAFAIDCSKKPDGSDFVLEAGRSLVAVVAMRAPYVADLAGSSDAAAKAKWYDGELKDGETEGGEDGFTGGAHAYNSITLVSQTLSTEPGASWSAAKPTSNYYTKVGLLPFSVDVKKTWDDADDRDGKRATSVWVTLYADGVQVDRAQLSEDNGWHHLFDHVTALNEKGDRIEYTLAEDPIAGYTGNVAVTPRSDGFDIALENYHEPEKITISGKKVWDDAGDAAGKRPKKVKINLYADGELLKTQEVSAPAGQDRVTDWPYTFANLPKYRPRGIEIKYEVREEVYYEGYDAPVIEGATVTNTYNPYGNLMIEKSVKDVTPASRDKEFTFTLEIDKAGVDTPDGGSYEWERSDGATGEISTGGTVTLKGGQSVLIKGIPSEYKYRVSEAEVPGFEATSIKGAEGVIRAGETRTARASFENTYDAEGLVRLQVSKELTGRALAANQFTFEVVDDATGEVVRTAANGEDGTVVFGALRYGLADVGKTYTYTIREQKPTAPGYEDYDAHTTRVSVRVEDVKGNGELTVTPTYDSSTTTFRNAYHAKGSLALKAWKTLLGRDLKDGEFRFELRGSSGAPMPAGGSVAYAVNKADGTISFPEIAFNETHSGKTYTYTAREVAGADATVQYSKQTFTYTVTVADNGDGTLSFEQTTNASPVFSNTLTPGGLRIEKHIQGTDGDPHQEFTFHVQLTAKDGQQLPSGTVPFERVDLTAGSRAGDEAAADDAGDGDGAAVESEAVADDASEPVAEPEPEPASDALDTEAPSAADDASETAAAPRATPKKGVIGGVTYEINAAGRLTLRPTTGSVGELPYYGEWPWMNNTEITSVVVSKTVKLSGAGGFRLFKGLSNMRTADLSGLDTSQTTWMSEMFWGCSSLTSLDLSGFNTAKVTTMHSMFCDCSSLTSLDLSRFSTAKVTTMIQLFRNCSSLTSLDLSSFSTAEVTTMERMFQDCSGLKSLNLSSFDTSRVTDMTFMFSDCSSLESLDLSSFDTAKVTSMFWMFDNCSSLESLDLSSFNTAKAGYVGSMFSGMTSLKEIKLGSGFKSLAGAKLPSPPKDSKYTGKWERTDKRYAFTASKLMQSFDPGLHAGTWVWQLAPTDYTVSYNPNASPVTGSMPNEKWDLNVDRALTKNKYWRFNYKFTGWRLNNPSYGTWYSDQEYVSNSFGRTDNSGITTLYAQWTPEDNNVTIRDGGFDITLHGNEGAVFKDLPANIGYNVYEKTPAGWVLVSSSGTTGIIPPNDEAVAKFTNTYRTYQASAVITAQKTLDGEAPDAGMFSFVLRDSYGTMLQTKSNAAGGGIQFDPITYSSTGMYTYKISELGRSNGPYDYDTTTYMVRVWVTNDGSGRLQASVEYPYLYNSDIPIFRNKTNDNGKGRIAVQKQLAGGYLKNQSFSFRVDWNGGLESEEHTLDSSNNWTWISDYKAPGTRYTITETKLSDGPYSFSGFVEWDGSNDGQGSIVVGNPVTIKIVNKYSVRNSVQFKAKKNLEGASLSLGQFTFALYKADSSYNAIGDPIQYATNDDNGDILFEPIEYTSDEYTPNHGDPAYLYYVIKEIAGSDPTINYSTEVQKVSVSLRNNGEDTLGAYVSYNGGWPGEAVFTNTLKPGYLEIKKTVDGPDKVLNTSFDFQIDLTDTAGNELTGSHDYVVLDADGTQVDAGTVKSGGIVSLKHGQTARVTIPAGTTYQVTEMEREWFEGEVTEGSDSGVIAPNDTSHVTFNNVYAYAAEGTFKVAATKRLVGAELYDKQFYFRLRVKEAPGHEDDIGKTYQASNDKDGNIVFDELRYTEVDAGKVFVYELFEMAGDVAGVTYDKTRVIVRARPVDNGDGTMTVRATYTESGKAEAKDKYGIAENQLGSGESGWTFENVKTVVVPDAGGRGIMLGTGAGLLLVLGCAAWILHRRRLEAFMGRR